MVTSDSVLTLLQHFVANHDGETIVSNTLHPELTARVLKIFPTVWNTSIALRAGVLASKNGKFREFTSHIIRCVFVMGVG